jgi:biofilm PGA synthesis N-glycosyltransferase PgaC
MDQLNIRNKGNGQYIVITPMRNEMRTIEVTIKALLSQTVLPNRWIILDDGSSDGCQQVVAHYAKELSWISHIKIADRGYDFVGQGVADLLNFGLKLLQEDAPVEFIAKLDADLDFENDYFESMLLEMKQEPRLGIVSGHPYLLEKDKKVFERHSSYFPSGTARLYRISYLNDIGPFVSSVGWDTVDVLRMRMHKHLTKICHHIPVHHMRPMGTRGGYINGMVRDGRNSYLTGYTPLFLLARALFNVRYYPYVLRTFCMVYGYFTTYVKGVPRTVSDKEYQFHAKLQRNRLLLRDIDVVD